MIDRLTFALRGRMKEKIARDRAKDDLDAFDGTVRRVDVVRACEARGETWGNGWMMTRGRARDGRTPRTRGRARTIRAGIVDSRDTTRETVRREAVRG